MSTKKKDDIIQEVNSKVIASLESGVVPWLMPYKRAMSIHGHVYRGINRLVLNMVTRMEGYESPYWLTFNAIKKREGNLRKGERSTTVVYNGFNTYEDGDGNEQHYRVFKHFSLFNMDQCDFDDDYFTEWIPTESQETSDDAHKIIADYIVREKIELTHSNGYACYSPKRDVINCPTPGNLVDPELYVPTLFHEMGHSTGHEKRLNREGITSIEHKSHKYSKEELIAEMTAAYLCGHVGMSMSHLEQSASYIDNWLKSLKDDKNILQDACTEAEASYQYILTGEKEENKT